MDTEWREEETYVGVKEPASTAVVEGPGGEEEEQDGDADQYDRPVDEHRARGEGLEVEPHDDPFETEEEAWNLRRSVSLWMSIYLRRDREDGLTSASCLQSRESLVSNSKIKA